MILTLTFISACLSLVHYLGLENFLYLGIGLPLPYYVGSVIFLLFIRLAMFVYRTVPVLKRMYLSLSRIVDRESKSVSPVKAPGAPNKIGVRKFSTVARKNIDSSPSSVASIPKTRVINNPSPGIYKTTLLRLRFKLSSIQELFTVKGGRPLVNILKGLTLLTGTSLTSGSIRYCCLFIVTCREIIRSQGIRGLTIYLKACGVSLQQSLGGHRVYNSTAIAGCRFKRTAGGIPRFIPPVIRDRIRRGDSHAIKLTLTLINVYRVFEFDGVLKLHTITKSFAGTDSLNKYLISVIPLFVRLFVWDRFKPRFLKAKLLEAARESVFPIFKGGPGTLGILGEWNSKPDITIRAMISLMRDGVLWESFQILLGLLEYPQINFAVRVIENIKDVSIGESTKPIFAPLAYLGKLGMKAEAAGKIRVFAMVDAWTQWVLYPYHVVLFKILEGIKMDGTFDQTAPLKYLKPVVGMSSLDLSAATDRLPIRIQKELLGYLFGYEFASAWSLLLVGRVYRLHLDKKPVNLKYEVGQPMGALSSWASLAFTHHFIIQAAAWRAGFPRWKLYTNYAVLGDDVVIGDRRVVTQYLLILESLGVEVGLHKSLLSPKGEALEFAKRTLYKGVDVSPISFKEFYAASRNLGAFVELFRKSGVSFATALQAFGVGWRTRSWLNKPIGKLSSRIRLLILAINVPTTPEMVTQFFELGRAPVAQYHNDALQVMELFVHTEIPRLISKMLLLGNAATNQDSVKWGRDFAREQAASRYGLKVEELLDLVKKGVIPKAQVLYPVQLIRDAFTNIANLTWHRAKLQVVEQIDKLIKELAMFKFHTFAELYMEYLRVNTEVSKLSLHAFAKVRPQIEAIPGILNPHQIRMWKRWSAIIQNSKKVED